MTFHFEYLDHERRPHRGNLLGETLGSAEEYAFGIIQRCAARDEAIRSGKIYEGDPNLVGFGTGTHLSTWDGDAWIRQTTSK